MKRSCDFVEAFWVRQSWETAAGGTLVVCKAVDLAPVCKVVDLGLEVVDLAFEQLPTPPVHLLRPPTPCGGLVFKKWAAVPRRARI